jgi:hypothetical protein
VCCVPFEKKWNYIFPGENKETFFFTWDFGHFEAGSLDLIFFICANWKAIYSQTVHFGVTLIGSARTLSAWRLCSIGFWCVFWVVLNTIFKINGAIFYGYYSLKPSIVEYCCMRVVESFERKQQIGPGYYVVIQSQFKPC